MRINHNFVIGPTDTDSISFCKNDYSVISKEEQQNLIKELNSISPEFMLWAFDGYFPSVICLKAKNYITYDGSKIKIKGSGLRDTKREAALREMISKVIDCLLFEKTNLIDIYNQYIKEAMNVTDIKRWAAKKTITASVLDPQRTNEQKVLDALKDTEYSEGDKRWFFFMEDDSLCLVERFNGSYNKMRLVEKVYKTMSIFSSVIDMSQFPKYHLKKNQSLLEAL